MERWKGWLATGRRQLAAAPVPLRYAIVGAIVAGMVGGLAGLVIGLEVYAPTAWFAVLEIGAPAALLGFVLGLGVGALTTVRAVKAAKGG